MNEKLTRYVGWLREGFAQAVRRYPLELLLTVYGCVGCLVAYELDSDDVPVRLTLVPLFWVLALVVNNLAGNGPWRKLYWACWVPIVPLWLWGGLETWLQSSGAMLTFGVLAPLALLMCRRAVRNDRFVADTFVWLRSGALALLFANVALGLFAAILFSTTYIFGLEGEWITHVWVYALILTETLCVPVLLLIMSDRWRGAVYEESRIIDILSNYIVTPALLIYTAILYLYMAKIVATWSLPRGGVAYLVFGFTLMALGVKALQYLLQKRPYVWFFNWFSLISIPTQVLFWAGVVRRTQEYGLTEPRVYLLVCGALMTLCVLLFLSQRAGRYLYVALAVFTTFAAIAYVPSLHARRIAVRSQVHRIEKIAGQLGMLGADGKLNLAVIVSSDSLQVGTMRRLYQSLSYLELRDSAAFARFGVKNAGEIADGLSLNLQGQVLYGENSDFDDRAYFSVEMSEGRCTSDISTYNTLYSDFNYWEKDRTTYSFFRNDTLRIGFGGGRPDFVISGAELLQTQLRKIGVENPDESTLRAAKKELLTYDDDDLKILFERMSFQRDSSGLKIDQVSVDAVLAR